LESIGFTSATKQLNSGLVATSAAWLATASWLARSFATTGWLSATCRLAAVVAMLLEHLREHALDSALWTCARIAARINNFATANWLAGCFATASWLAGCFATASRLAAAAFLVEQAAQESWLLGSTSGITASWLATASRLAGCFATASRLATANRLDITTGVAALVTQLVKQAKRASVG
jgi:hypothetical protein